MLQKKVNYKLNTERSKHNLREILRSLMVERGVDDARLSQATGIATSSLSRIKNDSSCNPTLASLQAMAKYFEVTVSQLIGETSISRLYVSEPNRHRNLIVMQIPVIQWNEIELFLEQKMVEFAHWIPSNLPISQQAFALYVQNASWGPVFCKGACLLMDPIAIANDGDYVLVHHQIDNYYYIKRLVIEGSDRYLQSLNPDIRITEKMKEIETVAAVAAEVRQQLKQLSK